MMVKGSVASFAKNKNIAIAEAMTEVDVVVLLDRSYSMQMNDAPEGRRRFDVACNQLAWLQGQMPGKVAVVGFSSSPELCPNGIPSITDGSTDMVEALRFVQPFDGLVRFVLISDGEPDDKFHTLKIASRFRSQIDTIFCGPEKDHAGRDFLAELAQATRGESKHITPDHLDQLGSGVLRLLNA